MPTPDTPRKLTITRTPNSPHAYEATYPGCDTATVVHSIDGLQLLVADKLGPD